MEIFRLTDPVAAVNDKIWQNDRSEIERKSIYYRKSDPKPYWPSLDLNTRVLYHYTGTDIISIMAIIINIISVLNHKGIMCQVSNSSHNALNWQEANHKQPLTPLYYTSVVHQRMHGSIVVLTLNCLSNYTGCLSVVTLQQLFSCWWREKTCRKRNWSRVMLRRLKVASVFWWSAVFFKQRLWPRLGWCL